METDPLLQQLLDSYRDSDYPVPFLEQYQIMECLADRNGITTFLVRNADGQNCIAKCYDQAIWTFGSDRNLLASLVHPGLPNHIASYENGGYYHQ